MPLRIGSAGVHLCHGMSYPISSKVRTFHPSGYSGSSKPSFVPHGLSVVLSAPAMFQWTAEADKQRHLRAAEFLGLNVVNRKADDAGRIIADGLREMLSPWAAFIPNGLADVGYKSSDVEELVKGTLPQRKVLDISPRPVTPEALQRLFENSMRLF